MLVKSAMNYIKKIEKMVWQRFTGVATTIKTDDDCDIMAVSINFYVNGRYCWVCAYDDDDVITWYVSGKGTAKEMTIEETQVKSMYKVLDKIEELAYEPDETIENDCEENTTYEDSATCEECVNCIKPTVATTETTSTDIITETENHTINCVNDTYLKCDTCKYHGRCKAEIL